MFIKQKKEAKELKEAIKEIMHLNKAHVRDINIIDWMFSDLDYFLTKIENGEGQKVVKRPSKRGRPLGD